MIHHWMQTTNGRTGKARAVVMFCGATEGVTAADLSEVDCPGCKDRLTSMRIRGILAKMPYSGQLRTNPLSNPAFPNSVVTLEDVAEFLEEMQGVLNHALGHHMEMETEYRKLKGELEAGGKLLKRILDLGGVE